MTTQEEREEEYKKLLSALDRATETLGSIQKESHLRTKQLMRLPAFKRFGELLYRLEWRTEVMKYLVLYEGLELKQSRVWWNNYTWEEYKEMYEKYIQGKKDRNIIFSDNRHSRFGLGLQILYKAFHPDDEELAMRLRRAGNNLREQESEWYYGVLAGVRDYPELTLDWEVPRGMDNMFMRSRLAEALLKLSKSNQFLGCAVGRDRLPGGMEEVEEMDIVASDRRSDLRLPYVEYIGALYGEIILREILEFSYEVGGNHERPSSGAAARNVYRDIEEWYKLIIPLTRNEKIAFSPEWRETVGVLQGLIAVQRDAWSIILETPLTEEEEREYPSPPPEIDWMNKFQLKCLLFLGLDLNAEDMGMGE